jgi:hypothetical protein
VRGGPRLPPQSRVRGGSLRRLSLSLAARSRAQSRARGTAPVGRRDLGDQRTPERGVMTQNRWIAWVRQLRQRRHRAPTRGVGLAMTWLRRREPKILHVTALTRRFAQTTIVRVTAGACVMWSQRSRTHVVVAHAARRVVDRRIHEVSGPREGHSLRQFRAGNGRVAARGEFPGHATSGRLLSPEVSASSEVGGHVKPRIGTPVRSRLRRTAPVRDERVLSARTLRRRQERMPADRPSLLVRAERTGSRQQFTDAPMHTSVVPGARPEPAWTSTPTANVDTLTDEVIRQIDRRVIAQRERLGRV